MKPPLNLFALFALFAANVSAATLLYDFENDAECAAVPRIENAGFTVGVTNGFATSGNHALSFVCKPWREGMDEWPSFTLPSPVADWRGYDRFVVDVVNADEEGDDLCLFVAGPDGRIQNGLADAFRIPGKGCAQWVVSLENWPKTTAPDNIARIHFFVTRPKHFVVSLDRLTLLRPGETDREAVRRQGLCGERAARLYLLHGRGRAEEHGREGLSGCGAHLAEADVVARVGGLLQAFRGQAPRLPAVGIDERQEVSPHERTIGRGRSFALAEERQAVERHGEALRTRGEEVDAGDVVGGSRLGP